MTDTTIIPAAERKLKNHISFVFAVKNTFTFAYRAFLKMLHDPETFFFTAIMPVIFTLLFSFLFGGAIAGSVINYLPIIIPGILLLSFVVSSSTAGAQLRDDMDKSTTNRFKSMPIARISPIAGMLIADFIRFTMTGVIVFVVGFIIGYRPEAGLMGILAAVLFMMIIAWCISWIFAFVCMSVNSPATGSGTSMMIMYPMVFLSNALVPTSTLPSGLSFFANHINPLSKAVSAIREILTFGTVGTDFWLAIIGALVILAIFIPLSLWVYTRKA